MLPEKCPNPYFPVFVLNTEIYSPFLARIRENTGQKKLRIRTLFTQWLCNKSIDIYENTQVLFCIFFEPCLCRLSLNVYILFKNNCSRFSSTISTRFHLWNSTTEVSACPVLRNNKLLLFSWVFLDWEEI